MNFSFKGFSFIFDNKDGSVSGKLVNNGYVFILKIIKFRGIVIFIGGFLGNSLYKFEQFYFYFGCENNKGFEYIINGYVYFGEVRM